VEHVYPESEGGHLELENLVWACPSCNLRKSDRLTAVDPLTGTEVPLFHPRRDRWADHLRFEEFELRGLTAVGRAVIAAFDLHSERCVLIRQAEAVFGLFPPDDCMRTVVNATGAAAL
jgi:hypothetical protein